MVPNAAPARGAWLADVPIVQRPRTWPFQGQNTGSNPVGDDSLASLANRPPTVSRRAASRSRSTPAGTNPVGDDSLASLANRPPTVSRRAASRSRSTPAGTNPVGD